MPDTDIPTPPEDGPGDAHRSAAVGAAALDDRLQHCRRLLNDGLFTEGEAAARALVDEAVEAARPASAAHAALLLARLMANTSRAGAAIAWSRRCLQLAADADAPHLQSSAWVVLAGASAESDQPVVALDAIARALALVDPTMAAPLRRSVFTGIAITYNALGLPRQALPAARRAFDAEDASGAEVDRLRERWNLLITGLRAHEQMQTVDAAGAQALLAELQPHGEALLDEARRDGRSVYLAGAAHAVGLLRGREGRWEQALALLTQSVLLPTEEQPGDLRDRWIALAQAHMACGDAASAGAAADTAASWAAQMGDVPGFQDLEALSELEEMRGRSAEALALHRRFHRQVMHNLLAALEVRLAERSSTVDVQVLRMENLDLRERMADLTSQARELHELAQTDALTGVLGRRAIQQAFDRRDPSRPWALLLVDADHFKHVNDRFSHGVGDTVLRELARLMSEHLRGEDRVGRYGGEEFVMLLAGASLAEATRVAQRLREAVQRHPWSEIVTALSVTISGGLVSVAPDETFEQAIDRADQLLYQAKDAGRNRVIVAPR